MPPERPAGRRWERKSLPGRGSPPQTHPPHEQTAALQRPFFRTMTSRWEPVDLRFPFADAGAQNCTAADPLVPDCRVSGANAPAPPLRCSSEAVLTGTVAGPEWRRWPIRRPSPPQAGPQKAECEPDSHEYSFGVVYFEANHGLLRDEGCKVSALVATRVHPGNAG